MRFTKTEVLDVFREHDQTYRLGILSANWLRHITNYTPRASDDARGMWMGSEASWISFADLADELERDPGPLVEQFMRNQLHTAIRVPYEMLVAYCDDFDKTTKDTVLAERLKAAAWYVYARAIRNALSHVLRYRFDKKFKQLLPTTWNGITITAEMDGQPVSWDTFGARPGYKLLREMWAFANTLPESPDETKHSCEDSSK